MIKIVIVDDDLLVTSALKTILEKSAEMIVVAVGHDANDAISLYQEYQPDILLLDIHMGQTRGFEAASEILKIDPQAKILFLSTFSDDEYIFEAFKIGVKGYLLKQDIEALIPAIEAVYNQQSVFGHTIAEKLPHLLENKNEMTFDHHDLSKRDLEILALVAEGLNNKEIAQQLFLSEGTVRNYISQLLEKLQLRDRTQLAIFYLKKIKK